MFALCGTVGAVESPVIVFDFATRQVFTIDGSKPDAMAAVRVPSDIKTSSAPTPVRP